MEERLQGMLTEGETLLWSGQPEPFKIIDRTNQKGLIASFIVKLIATAAILMLYFRVALSGDAGVQPGVVILILLVAAFAFYYPVHTATRLRRSTYYGLTDRRILRVGTKDESVPYDRIKNAALRTDEDGQSTLLCGPHAVKLRPGRWRNEADVPFDNDTRAPEAQSVILYALPMDERLRGLLKQYLPVR